uniref:Uncharacterized protein n=1 Tax=Anguilla anguilla TaxID=7936 RepID=A0A0E9SST6_ANGAN
MKRAPQQGARVLCRGSLCYISTPQILHTCTDEPGLDVFVIEQNGSCRMHRICGRHEEALSELPG